MTRTMRITTTLLALALPAGPLAAQDAPPPPPDRPGVERLERLRMERMHEALELTDAQAAELQEQMQRTHAEMRTAMEANRTAMAALREELGREPVDQDAVARSLARVEAQRQAMDRLREAHQAATAASLTPEQRAKMLLFSREFDGHLRELMARRRAPEMRHGSPGAPPGVRRPGPGAEPGVRRPAPAPERRREPMDRDARIERLRRQIDQLQRQLAELEASAGQ